MKGFIILSFMLATATTLANSFCYAESLYQQRSRQNEEENKAYYHQLYQARTAELTAKIEDKLRRMAAGYGGATNFAFECPPGVSGSTYLFCGLSFQTVQGNVACEIGNFGYDFAVCRGANFTNCPDFRVYPKCLDENRQPVDLRNVPAGKVHRHRQG